MDYVIPYRVPDNGAKIMEQVIARHRQARTLVPNDYIVLFTSLIGSQNYGLEGPDSDLDTYSFIIPPISKLISLEKPMSFEKDLEKEGKIVVKDYRLAFKSLRKTNPAAIEWFCTRYMCIDLRFKSAFDQAFSSLNFEDLMHCNPENMAKSIYGSAQQYMSRHNMPLGKRYAHMVRLSGLDLYYYANATHDFFPMPQSLQDQARAGKFGKIDDKTMQETMNSIMQKLRDRRDNYTPSEYDKKLMTSGNLIVDLFMKDVFDRAYQLSKEI